MSWVRRGGRRRTKDKERVVEGDIDSANVQSTEVASGPHRTLRHRCLPHSRAYSELR